MGIQILLALCVPLASAEPGLHKGSTEVNPELTRLVHEAIVARVPKKFEDRSAWGKTITIPSGSRRPRLRTRVPAGDHGQVPHGLWKRTRVWLDNPAQDIRVQVQGPHRKEDGILCLRVDMTAALHGERERQRWIRGVKLFGITAQADAVVAVALDCEVRTSLEIAELPPRLRVKPMVTKARLDLKEFDLLRVGNVLEGEQAREVGNELKGVLEELLRSREPDIKEYATQAMAATIVERTATLFPGLLKVHVAVPTLKTVDRAKE